jgi:hypothetical protein
VQGFSKAMALRRLHWRNSLLGELLYTINVAKVGLVCVLLQRWLTGNTCMLAKWGCSEQGSRVRHACAGIA